VTEVRATGVGACGRVRLLRQGAQFEGLFICCMCPLARWGLCCVVGVSNLIYI
jgi:hypothetical protein